MFIRSLTLTSFRNFERLELEPGPGLNIFVGANAQGKTSILEAVGLLATTRSFRAGRESEMVRITPDGPSEFAQVRATVVRERRTGPEETELEMTVMPGEQKSVRVNRTRKTRVIDLLGELNAVFFGSINLSVVTGEPSERRRFLNTEISQMSPKYVMELARYRKALEQRNRLLKELRDRPTAMSGLEAWSAQVAQYGAPLSIRRRDFIEDLIPRAAEIHRIISGERELLALNYRPGTPVESGWSEDKVREAFMQALEARANEEVRRGTTATGPQRDDMGILVDTMEARLFGSQGQQRTAALAIKLADYDAIREAIDERPVLLLDDVMSDLDVNRRSHLLARASEGGQTFLTCTDLDGIPTAVLKGAVVHKVVAGAVV